MIVWMLLLLIGLALPFAGLVGLIVGLRKKEKKIWVTSIAIPVSFWAALFLLAVADHQFAKSETEKNGGVTPDWVW